MGALLLLLVVVLAVKTATPASVPGGAAQVFYRERANGVHPRLQALLDDWTVEGTWDVTIGGGNGFPGGGLRTQADVDAAAAAGLSRATNLSQTAHGRGAALDVWPAGFDPFKSFDEQPGMQELMNQFGQWAKGKGFLWGGDFPGYFSPSATVTGDWPHIELPNWVALPFPPPDYGGTAA